MVTATISDRKGWPGVGGGGGAVGACVLGLRERVLAAVAVPSDLPGVYRSRYEVSTLMRYYRRTGETTAFRRGAC